MNKTFLKNCQRHLCLDKVIRIIHWLTSSEVKRKIRSCEVHLLDVHLTVNNNTLKKFTVLIESYRIIFPIVREIVQIKNACYSIIYKDWPQGIRPISVISVTITWRMYKKYQHGTRRNQSKTVRTVDVIVYGSKSGPAVSTDWHEYKKTRKWQAIVHNCSSWSLHWE